LVRKNLNILNSEEKNRLDSSTFKFIFFMSLPSREESVALELCEGLQSLYTKYGLDNFELHLRLTNDGKEVKKHRRWDPAYIDEVLGKYSQVDDNCAKEDLETVTTHHHRNRRVWVCGPPQMNEMFDRALEILGPKHRIARHTIVVL
jgi:predicted ferric reductase